MNKRLTVLFIPDHGEKTYEVKLGRSLVWLIVSIIGFCTILLGFGLNGILEAGRLKHQIAVLRREVLLFESQEKKINELEQMLLRLQKSNEKLRTILGSDNIGMGGVFESYYLPVHDRMRWGHIESVPSIWPMSGVFVEQTTKIREAIFIPAARGTPVRATANGNIRKIVYDQIFGRQIIVDHGNALETYYGYLCHVFVGEGEWVLKGQNIGLSGDVRDSQLEGLRYAVINGPFFRNSEDYRLWQ